MIKLANARIIFVEGDTEVSLFQSLKQKNIIQAKKIVKKNLWCEDIKKYSVNIPNKSDLVVIFDTDQVDKADRFIKNINYLLGRKHSVFLFQQTLNFEDELSHCCAITKRKLFSEFCKNRTAGVSDFKRDFIACNNPVDKLKALGINSDRWFVRDLHASLTCLNKYHSNFLNFFESKI